MDFKTTFPLRYWINLGRRNDRRVDTEWKLETAGVDAQRFPAVDARHVPMMALEKKKRSLANKPPAGTRKKTIRGYENEGRYALALTQRMAIRQAKLQKADAVAIFEDDVTLHPNFLPLLEAMELPDDWGIFYFGCAHYGYPPNPAGPGIVQTTYGIDTHAFAVRAPYYDQVIAALDAHGKPTPEHPLASDRFLAALHHEIPAYSCFPNLAWQAASQSDLIDAEYTNYQLAGTQKHRRDNVEPVFKKMYCDVSATSSQNKTTHLKSKLGLLFLTRGDVTHPKTWSEFTAEAPDRVRVVSHPKDPTAINHDFLKNSVIGNLCPDTRWGDISLVRATLSLLREALQDPGLTHFVLLSESCIPIQPLSWMLSKLDAVPAPRFNYDTLENASVLKKSRASAIPQVPAGCWHFQSQWWLLDRITANWVTRADYTDVFSKMGIPDEAYFATVLSLMGYPIGDRVVKKDITWTWWEKNAGSPTTFHGLNPEKLHAMVESGCWFARKFSNDFDPSIYNLHRTAIANQ